MPTVYVVRHGATTLNNDTDLSEDRIRGWADVPLAPAGKEEAKHAAEKLRPFGIQVIVTSPLVRAAETAQIISQALGGVPVQVNPGLRPWNLGNFTGQSTKDALPQIAIYVQQQQDTPVPGGESFNQFKAHAIQGLMEAIELAGGRPLAIVTHHRDERLWRALEAAGWTGQVDLSTFLQKGDPPGGVFEMNVPAQMGGTTTPPPGAPAVGLVSGAGAPPMPPGAAAGPPGGGLPVPAPGQPPGAPAPPGMPGQAPQPDPMMGVLMKLQQIKGAIDLLRKDVPRGYRIDIEIDTMVAGDHQQERQDATEFVQGVTQFVTAAGAIVPHLPLFAPLAGKMLQFAVRKFRTGRDLESAIDEFADKIAKLPPGALAPQQQSGKDGAGPQDAAVAAAQVKTAQVKAQAEQTKAVTDAKTAQDNDQREAQLKAMEFQMKMREFQMRMAEMEREEQYKMAEHTRRMQQGAVSAIASQNRVAQNGNGLSSGPPGGQ